MAAKNSIDSEALAGQLPDRVKRWGIAKRFGKNPSSTVPLNIAFVRQPGLRASPLFRQLKKTLRSTKPSGKALAAGATERQGASRR
jgi:hypothetical protein